MVTSRPDLSARTPIGVLLATRQAVLRDQPLHDLAGMAAAAEQVGFASVWAGESITAKPRPDLCTILAACAMTTDTVTLGSAAALPGLCHPVRFAHQYATLDQLSGGRLIVGVGAGYPGENTQRECETFGVDYRTRREAMDAVVETARKFWRGDGTSLQIAPAPSNGTIPLWLGGEGAATKQRCGRLYDGWIPTSASTERLAESIAEVRKTAERCGRDPASVKVATILTMVIDDDASVAELSLLRYLQEYYRIDAPLSAFAAVVGCVAGTVEQCASRVAEFGAAEADHVIVRFAVDDQLGAIRDFGPQLAGSAARPPHS